MEDDLRAEAQAFDSRIEERLAFGFIPDLQQLTENDYFYKSFWRSPLYADLYVGEMSRNYIRYFGERLDSGSRILDVGCGPGYFSLELARAGFHVTAIDISGQAIEAARDALEGADRGSNFGSLTYIQGTTKDLTGMETGAYDGALSSGFLHHLRNLDAEVATLASLIRTHGTLVLHEPQHHFFRREDAFWIAVIRLLLAKSGVWLDDFGPVQTVPVLEKVVEDTYREYTLERDATEPLGQSPNDLSGDREEILHAVERSFLLEEITPSRSFIYRTLGGLRGSTAVNHEIAPLLALIDSFAVHRGYLTANYFYAVGRKVD